MRKIIVYIFFFFFVLSAGYLLFSNIFPSRTNKFQTGSSEIEKIADQKRIGIPQTLIISKINISTNVELVGEDSQGRMDVPKDVNNVGWYTYGFKPGENGNSVISGHLDSEIGPAVFYNLGLLNIGDEIEIMDEDNKIYRFKVANKATYDFDKVPLNEIFGNSDKPKLNLITCDGVFDRNTRNYSKRFPP